MGHYSTEQNNKVQEVSFQIADQADDEHASGSLVDNRDDEEKAIAETPSNQQMMDIKSIIPQIDYTNKYVSAAARPSQPFGTQSIRS